MISMTVSSSPLEVYVYFILKSIQFLKKTIDLCIPAIFSDRQSHILYRKQLNSVTRHVCILSCRFPVYIFPHPGSIFPGVKWSGIISQFKCKCKCGIHVFRVPLGEASIMLFGLGVNDNSAVPLGLLLLICAILRD